MVPFSKTASASSGSKLGKRNPPNRLACYLSMVAASYHSHQHWQSRAGFRFFVSASAPMTTEIMEVCLGNLRVASHHADL
jgi:hypothetical protein